MLTCPQSVEAALGRSLPGSRSCPPSQLSPPTFVIFTIIIIMICVVIFILYYHLVHPLDDLLPRLHVRSMSTFFTVCYD